ncbi:MAG: hypothetical protein K6F23_06030, partial [Solobacterium sp.]|nr:hypothetical protein [Solobacterium sp.]
MAVILPASAFAGDSGSMPSYSNEYGFPDLAADAAVPIEIGTAGAVDIVPGFGVQTFVFTPAESGTYYVASDSSAQGNEGSCDPVGRVIDADGTPLIWNDAYAENDDTNGRDFGIRFKAEAGESCYIQVIDCSDQEENAQFSVSVYSADNPQWSVSTHEENVYFSLPVNDDPGQAELDAWGKVTYGIVPPELHYAWYRCNASGTDSQVGEDAPGYKATAGDNVRDEYKVVISDDAGKKEEIQFHVAYEDVEWSLKQKEANVRLLNGAAYLSPEPYIECKENSMPYLSDSWYVWNADTAAWKAWRYPPSDGSNATATGDYKVVFTDMFEHSGEIVFHVIPEWDDVSADAETIGEEEYRDVQFTKEAEEVTYKFVPQKDGEYFFTSGSAGSTLVDTIGRVADENGETIAQEDQGGRENEQFGIRFSAKAGSTYYLQAREYNGNADVSFRVMLEEYVEDQTWSRIVTEATLPMSEGDSCVTANAYDFIQFEGSELPPVEFEWEWLDPDSGNYEYMGSSCDFDMYFEGDYRVNVIDLGEDGDPGMILFHVVKDNDLAAAKADALSELDNYDLSGYTAAERKQVKKLLKGGRAAIMAASSTENVTTALNKAKDDIQAVKEVTQTVVEPTVVEQTIKVTPTVSLSTTTYTWNGKVRKPAVTVKAGGKTLMSKGTVSNSNVTLTYAKGRKNVGKYSVKVKLKGKYAGSKSATFKIRPKGTTIKKLVPKSKKLKVKWYRRTAKMSSSRITGYQI